MTLRAGAGTQVIETQPAEAHNALIAIEATSRQALADLTRTLGAPGAASPAGAGPDLARSPLDPAPGLAGIAQLAETAMRTGVRVDVRWHGDRRPLPAGIDQSAALAGFFLAQVLIPRSGMRLGDVKLALGLGVLLGWFGWSAVIAGGCAGCCWPGAGE